MDTNDLINGLFESGGSIVIWLNVLKLYKDRVVKGVYYPIWIFYSWWGLWNLYYYPSLGQWISFTAGLAIVAGNIVWSIMAFYYMYYIRKIKNGLLEM